MLTRFAKNRRGVAAVEFALLAPILVLMYCGLAEITMAMMAGRQAAHAASVVGDLVAQSSQINSTEVSDIFTVGAALMKPFPASALQLRVTSVKADTNGVPRVVWSQGYGMGALPTNSTPGGFPPHLLDVNDSVIKADVAYTFTSPVMHLLPNPVNYSDSFYLKPRRAPDVAYSP